MPGRGLLSGLAYRATVTAFSALLYSSQQSPLCSLSSSSSSHSVCNGVMAALSHPNVQTITLQASDDSHFIDDFNIQQVENPLWRQQQNELAQLDKEAAELGVQSRDHANLREKLNLIPQTVSAAPLTGCSSVDFSAAVTLGTQGPFKLIVDTGSTTLAVASTQCTTCGVTPLYTETATNLVGTANAVQSLYGTGTVGWTGSAYTETVSVGTPAAPTSLIIAGINTQMAFFQNAGCDTTVTTNTNQGIMGMAYPGLAVNPTQAFFTQWQLTSGNPNTFAIQMCRKTGTLWLGGLNTAAFTGSILWINIVRNLYYNLNVQDVATAPAAAPTTFTSLGITPAVYNAGFAIADSGTTLMLLPSAAYSQLITNLQADANFAAAFGANFFTSGFCVSSTQTVATLNAKLPLLRVTLADAQSANPLFLTVSAVNSYLRVIEPTTQAGFFYCPGIGALSQGTILGWSFLNQFVVVHDIQNSLIGFAPSTTCVSATTTDTHQSPAGTVSGGIANPNFPAATTTTAAPTAAATTAAAATTKAAATTAAATTKAGTATTAAAATTKAVATTAAATTAAAVTASAAPPKRSSLLQWVINQIFIANNNWQVTMTAGKPDVINFTYTAPAGSNLAFNALVWLASSKSLPIYLSSSVPANNGVGVFNYVLPTDGSVPAGAYNLVVATTATTFTTGPAVVITSTVTNLCVTSVCSFHGVCTQGACTCFAGFTGTNCQTAVAVTTTNVTSSTMKVMAAAATVACVNGVVMNGACYCNANYRGVDCSLLYLQASLTYMYSYTQVASQLGLFASLLATDLYPAAGLPSIAYVSLSNVTTNINMAITMSNQVVTATFNLQCNTTNPICTVMYLYTAYQTLQTAVADPTSDFSLSLSGQTNARDLVLAATSATAVAAATTTTTTTSTFSTFFVFSPAVIIALALGGVAVLVVVILALMIQSRKEASAYNINMTKQQTRV